MKLKIGQHAPDFSLPDDKNKIHSLEEYRGKRALIYFYPKDDTSGCTKQACGIQNALPDFKKLKLQVLGISIDSPESHGKFKKKYNLTFTLLSDEKKEVVKKYGVWKKKKFMGKEYLGTVRTSFLVGSTGLIEEIFEDINPVTHVDDVLAALKTP